MPRRVIIPGMPFESSPNRSERHGLEPSILVIHYTAGGDGRRTANWLREAATKRSAHFVGFRDGNGTQLVPLDKAAWHAGASEAMHDGEMRHGANRFSIGVELANHGLLHRGSNGRFWYQVAGNLYRYQGPEPVHADLVFDDGHVVSGWWEPYAEAQLKWLERLVLDLRNEGYKLELVGHEEIGVPFHRKTDPGAVFPWERFGRLHCDRRTVGRIHNEAA